MGSSVYKVITALIPGITQIAMNVTTIGSYIKSTSMASIMVKYRQFIWDSNSLIIGGRILHFLAIHWKCNRTEIKGHRTRPRCVKFVFIMNEKMCLVNLTGINKQHLDVLWLSSMSFVIVCESAQAKKKRDHCYAIKIVFLWPLLVPHCLFQLQSKEWY